MPFSFFDNSVNNNAGTPGIFQSIAVDRPAADALPVGSLFVDTTNNLIQRTNGSNWVTIGQAGGGTITGGGTTGALAKWSSGTALGDAIAGTDYATPGQLASYLPLSGGTLTGTLTGGRIIYNTAQARTTAGLAIHNSSAQDVAIFGASGGLNTSFLGTITATSIIRSGGTSAQFLKADGSVDSNTYATTSQLSSYLPLTGGTLTGSITATSIIRSGGTSAQILAADGSVITAGTNITISGGQINASGGITGSGTAGQLTLWNGTSSVTGDATFTYGANAGFLVNPSISAITGTARAQNIISSLFATANNDSLIGLDIAPTFSNGVFTGVRNVGLRVQGINFFRGNGNINTNIAIGDNNTLSSNTSGSNIIAIGLSSLNKNTTGIRNVAIGSSALVNITTGSTCVAIGFQALSSITTNGASVAIGDNAGSATTGANVVSIGAQSLQNISGGGNTAVGAFAIQGSALGAAQNNTGIGNNALNSITSGNNNTAVGYQAGRYFGVGNNNATTIQNGVYIGYDVRASANGNTNEIVISGYTGTGDGQIGLGSNRTVLGNNSTTATRIFGNLWLGTNSGSTSASIPLTLNATGVNNGSQVLYTNDYATGYTGISADTRGDMAMQTEAAGTGSDKGIKLNTNGNNTRIYVTNNGNIGANTTTQFGAGVLVIGIANATTVPTVNPTGGGVLYVEAGSLKYRGSSGTVTTIANA